jgi:hypothetical protein
MSLRSIAPLALLLLLPAGCSQDSSTSEGATPVAAPQVVSIEYAGMYEVTGVTSVDGSDIEREITGKIVLAEDGEGFSSKFSMSTRIQTEGGVVAADLNGTGEATRTAEGLSGTADTQMTLGAAPGLDPKFGFLPGLFGPRVLSNWTATPIDADNLEIEITTVAAPGEDYQATTTTMHAARTSGPKQLQNAAVSSGPPRGER